MPNLCTSDLILSVCICFRRYNSRNCNFRPASFKEPHTVENELTEEDLQHKLIFDQIQKEDEEAALNFESEDVAQDKASFSSTLTEIEPNSR